MRLHSCTTCVTQSLDRDVMDVMDVKEGFRRCIEAQSSTSYDFV